MADRKNTPTPIDRLCNITALLEAENHLAAKDLAPLIAELDAAHASQEALLGECRELCRKVQRLSAALPVLGGATDDAIDEADKSATALLARLGDK